MKPLATKATLWRHQEDGIKRALLARDFAFFFEQGTGKTLTAITLLRTLYARAGKPLRTLILCPAIVVENWVSEFQRFSNCSDLVEPLKGTKLQRMDALKEKRGKSIYVTNFESLDMDGLFWTKKGRVTKLLEDFEVLVVDESHRLKNPAAKRTKMAIKMADKAAHRYILTGTPILNSEEDVWSQFRILDKGETFGTSFYSFRNEYFYDENAGKPANAYWPSWKIRPGVSAALTQRIATKSMRVEKSECLDLPPLVAKRVAVPLQGEQAKHYRAMEKDYITFLGSAACTAQMALTRALRLMQIISGFLPLEGGEERLFAGCERERALAEMLEDHASKPVIVWASFHANYAAIANVCHTMGLPYGFLTGGQSAREKETALTAFREGLFRVLIAAPGAGGTGVNLVEAPTALWYSRSFSLEHRLQAQARNYRGGSERHSSVTHIDLVSPGTIDEECLAALERKEAVSENILDFSRSALTVR